MSKVTNFKDLHVWQKSIELTEKIYSISSYFPKHEQFGLTNQLRRASVSIPSNIAEGHGRAYTKDYIRFLKISIGSSAEVETQLILAKRFNSLEEDSFNDVAQLLSEVQKMLKGLKRSLVSKLPTS